jgi:4-amino-4-deoxy-L-arabinose transferase-like glycosyltransferase
MKKHSEKSGKWLRYVCIALVIGIAAFMRIWLLDRIPTGIVADETDYILNAKAIYETGGSILTANWSPWSLTTVPGEIPKGELPYVVSIPFVGPFGLSLFTARIGYALLSVLFVLTVMGIAGTLFGPWTGIAAGLVAAINPWSVYYGRTAYDVPVAILGYTAALYFLIRFRGPRLLFALFPLFVGFYSYIGTKVLFVPYTLVALIGAWQLVHKRTNTRWFMLIGVIALLVFANYAIHIRSLDANERVSQLFTPTSAAVVNLVDSQRRLTLASPLTRLFANKPIVFLKEAVIKFFGAFSPSILFTNGEGIATFSLWEHGLFYPLDALFLVIALCALFSAALGQFVWFAILICLSTLPSVMSTAGTTYVHRSSLMYPFFMILIGYGIVWAIGWLKKGYWRHIGAAVIAFTYVILTANFVYLYFFRFPYYNSEAFGLSQRLYTKYSTLAATHGIPVVNITGSAVGYFRNYIFYNNIPSKTTIPKIREAFATGNFSWDNTVFTKTCPTAADIAKGTTAYILSDTSPCKQLFLRHPMVVIPTLADGGMLYMIFNDRLCSQYALSGYPTGFALSDFDVEKLSEKQFCERFVIRYSQPLFTPAPEK